MPEGLKLFVWAVCIIVLVYTIWFLFGLVSIRSFVRNMKQKLKAAAVLFAGKRDFLLSLYAYCQKAGASFQEDDAEKATKARWTKLDLKKAEDVERVQGELSILEKRLNRYLNENENLKQGQEYLSLKESLDDLNSNYRLIVATYDNDLVGYDYWRKHFLFRWLFFLCGYRERKRLS